METALYRQLIEFAVDVGVVGPARSTRSSVRGP